MFEEVRYSTCNFPFNFWKISRAGVADSESGRGHSRAVVYIQQVPRELKEAEHDEYMSLTSRPRPHLQLCCLYASTDCAFATLVQRLRKWTDRLRVSVTISPDEQSHGTGTMLTDKTETSGLKLTELL